jgi:lactate dehydrogenase-like 2-hydroxyacid dehydrogenase
LGSASIETRNEMGNRVVQNLIEFFNGREPLDKVA